MDPGLTCMSTSELAAQLKALTRGLWFPSETEAPWTLPTWTLTSLDPSEIRRVLRRAPDIAVTEVTLDHLMKQVSRRCQGYGDEGEAIAQQHHALAKCLNHHCDTVRVFRVGNVTIDVLVIGQTPNHHVLLQTQSVET